MTGDEVVIAGRTFRIEGVYAPRPDMGRGAYKPRRLLNYHEDSLLPDGKVTVAVVPSGRLLTVAGAVWADWAGKEIRP